MFTEILCLSFFLLSATTAQPYTPTNYFLLNCGATTNTTSRDSRQWDSDSQSKFTSPNALTISSTSNSSQQDSSIDPVPFMTARIFNSSFTYTFPVSPGPKFLRLYFYPANYSTFLFNVTSNGYSLLSNFSAFLTVSAQIPETEFLIKEFIITIETTQLLTITFSPSPNSYAFVNGIEVVSAPDKFYIRGDSHPVNLVGQTTPYTIDDYTALEKLYRLNVGGKTLGSTADTGMFRSWELDDPYIYGADFGFVPNRVVPLHYSADAPNYTAPAQVYTTSRTMGNNSMNYNLTWIFSVDTGFNYLLRLHFCEIQLDVTGPNQRVFSIFINNQTAEEAADVIDWGGGVGYPVKKDYILWVQHQNGRPGKQDLWLAMKPNTRYGSMYGDALLNGLEIFKLNGSDGSLAAPNPELISTPSARDGMLPSKNGSRNTHSLAAIIGGVAGGIAILSILAFVIYYRRRRRGTKYGSATSDDKSLMDQEMGGSKSTKTSASSLPSDRCRRFSLVEIKSGTDDFSDKFVIGKGGFGMVYKGHLDNGAITVAIKRLNSSSSQGVHEFQTEIAMLSKLRHLHLVSLIGYCDDDGEMLLVYDYMAHGTLREHLYNSNNQPLSWKRRVEICIGAALGLDYLHTGANRSIIHRDVKSTNILLDEKWGAKVSDFGLSRLGPKDMSQSHVSTAVKGSFGYLDPEYYKRHQLTDKSDVYSFGVVLFEVLCARPVIIPKLPKEQVNLAEWAKFCYRRGTLDRMLDSNLKGVIAPECLNKFCQVAHSCLKDNGMERPTMSEVVWNLNFALQLQEDAEKKGGAIPFLMHTEATTTDDDEVFSDQVSMMSKSSYTSVTTCSDGFKSETVFSEIINPIGRAKRWAGFQRKGKTMSSRQGPPKHQNKIAWKPNAGVKINETEVGGRFRPLSEVTGVCPRCRDQIEWKRKYGKYKALSEPAKCQRCTKRNVRQAYHNLCTGCAKEHKVCAKCSCRVERIVGRDIAEVAAEQKMLEEAINNAREREKRTLLRTMNKGKSSTSETPRSPTHNGNKAGDLFKAGSLAEYAGADVDADDDDDEGYDSEEEARVVN